MKPLYTLLLASCIAFAQIAIGAQDEATKLYGKGMKELQNGKYGAAAKSFTKAIKLKDGDKKLYKARGDAYLGLKKWGDAMDDFDKAIALDPKYGEAYTGRGKAKYGMGDKDKGCLDYVEGRQYGDKNAFDLIRKDCEKY